jgi:serine/threonine protein kinase
MPTATSGGGIAFPFMRNGSLADVLARVKAEDPPPFWTATGRSIVACGILSGIEFFRSREAVHGGLKPSNIFIDDRGRAVSGGLSSRSFVGGDSEAGVFSFGLILSAILTGVVLSADQATNLGLLDCCSPEGRGLIAKCLAANRVSGQAQLIF